MAFVARSFNQILADMIAYTMANTSISDFEVGSVARTILEAAALEDDEQYFQMTQLLAAFRFTTARGEDLDRRLADFGIFRREATHSIGRVRFFNSNLTTDQAASDSNSGALSVQVFESNIFPTTGFPYEIRIGEGTTRIQTVTVTANNTATNTLTLSSPLTDDVETGDRVSLITGAQAYTIPSGTSVQSRPSVGEAAKTYVSQEAAFISAGNFFSNQVLVRSVVPGRVGNVGARRIVQFSSSAPFSGAGVLNSSSTSGGNNRENDSEFLQRALQQLQSLSRGTPLALKTASVGVTDASTGQRAVSANIIEDFVNDEVIVYIDDGSGLIPDFTALASASIENGGVALPSSSLILPVSDVSEFPSSGWVLIEEDGTNPTELVEFISKNTSTNSLTLQTATSAAHEEGSTVLFVDVLTQDSEAGRRRFSLTNPPIVRGTDRVFYDPGTGWLEMTPGTDYVLNKGTGEFQLVDTGGAAIDSKYVAHYSYYTNLVRAVQQTLEGNPDAPTQVPGVKAAGIFLSVEAPSIRRITVVMSIAARTGFREEDLAPIVKSQVEAYISSLRIGEDVVKSKLVDVAFNVKGVRDVFVSLPSANVPILENELPLAFNADGVSLVTVL